MSTFMTYAMAASQEALEDSGWKPKTDQEQEMTVRCFYLE
jgi:3-oxoacyl-(acyl-carrier-protein) synthase